MQFVTFFHNAKKLTPCSVREAFNIMISPHTRARAQRAALIAPWLLAAGALAQAQTVIPAGGSQSLGGGTMDLGCTDLIVHGSYDLAGGSLTGVRSVTVSATGTLAFGTGGAISLAGDWANSGTVSATDGSVQVIDDAACAAASAISGDTTFGHFSVTSTTGKLVSFAAGSVQTVQGTLTLAGAAGTPLRLESSTPGTPSADIRLAASGTQALSNLAVRGMSATGQWLAPGQTNQGAGPVSRWFGTPTPDDGGAITPVPTASQWTLLALALALGALGARQRRTPNRNNFQEGNRS